MKLPIPSIASCDDSSCELLISPIPKPRIKPLHVSVKPKRRRVTLLDTKKPNSIAILRRVGEMLRERGIEVEPQIRIKDDPSRPMPGDVLDWIARDEGLLLCGIAD